MWEKFVSKRSETRIAHIHQTIKPVLTETTHDAFPMALKWSDMNSIPRSYVKTAYAYDNQMKAQDPDFNKQLGNGKNSNNLRK